MDNHDGRQVQAADQNFDNTLSSYTAVNPFDATDVDLDNYLTHEQVQFLDNASANFPLDPSLDADVNFQDFSKFLPGYSEPPTPCDYCRFKGLGCFLYDGCSSCSSCNTLFRECSFVKNSPFKGVDLDTLHMVAEDAAQEIGTVTGKKTLFSSGATLLEMREHLPERSKVGRYPKPAVKILKDWLSNHCDHPYPTEEEKAALISKTGLRKNQIDNWLANSRRRGKARPNLSSSGASAPIDIAAESAEFLTPLERWRASPPEHEPASMTNIIRAVARSDLTSPTGAVPPYISHTAHRTSSTASMRSGWKPPSTTSLETSISEGSLPSSAHSHGSRSSYGSFAKLDRRRRRRTGINNRTGWSTPDRSTTTSRKFKCTFCCDSFRTKYDWARHEKSLHLSSEKWICAPLGPIITDVDTGHRQCVYCLEHDPSPEHLESHNHSSCEEKGKATRTFYRKDHLRQHLRLVHNVSMHNGMASWMSSPAIIHSRCGLCQAAFTTWNERVEHLAKHFKAGMTMDNWKGDWGFEPHVTAMVTNCMPPFLIGAESKTRVPFSATNAASMGDHELLMSDVRAREMCKNEFGVPPGGYLANIDELSTDRRASCWEILTVRLGEYVRGQKRMGVHHVSDEMLQRQGRLLLYGEEDGWNQTAADNTEWLTLFKQSHGLTAGMEGPPTVQAVAPSSDASEIGLSSASIAQVPEVFPHYDFLGDEGLDHDLLVDPISSMPTGTESLGDMSFDDYFMQDIERCGQGFDNSIDFLDP